MRNATPVARQAAAIQLPGETWVKLAGRVESVSAGFMPNPTPALYPTIVVKGTAVKTSAEAKVWCTDGSAMAASEIKVGQAAEVEGWKKSDGSVRAAKILIAQ